MYNKDIKVNLPSNKNKSTQQFIAGFVTYDYAWESLKLSSGLRDEYIDFEYILNDKISNEQSRIYKNLFPTLSISYNIKNINMSLAYRTTVRRPNYYNLRSSIAYNTPYT